MGPAVCIAWYTASRENAACWGIKPVGNTYTKPGKCGLVERAQSGLVYTGLMRGIWYTGLVEDRSSEESQCHNAGVVRILNATVPAWCDRFAGSGLVRPSVNLYFNRGLPLIKEASQCDCCLSYQNETRSSR